MKKKKTDLNFHRLMRGVTMVELLIVLGIIGILAAMAVPSYQSYRAKLVLNEALDKMQEGLMNTRITAIKANYPIYYAPLGASFNNGYTRKVMSAPPALAPTALEYSGAAFDSRITYSAQQGVGATVSSVANIVTDGVAFDRHGKLANMPGDLVITLKSPLGSSKFYEGSLTVSFNGLVTKECCVYK